MNLRQEKQTVLSQIEDFTTPLEISDKIKTHDMLKAIIAKCEHLIITDF